MTNPQFVWSLCVLLGIWIITRKNQWSGWLGVLVFVGLGLKFYFIIPALILIFWYVLTLIISRKFKRAFITVLSTGIGLGIAYLVFYTGGASGGLVWKPLEIPHQMVEDTNLWYDQIMVQERYYIQQLGHMWSPRLWWIEARTIFYFIFFNFGIRLFGVIGVVLFAIFNKKNTRQFVPILFAVIVCTLMPILFIQRGTWWNSIQFLYYAIFLSSILTAEFVWQISQKRNMLFSIVIVLICICLFLPTNYEMAIMYSSQKGVRYIPDEEIHALQILRKLPYGVVLTQAFSPKDTNILADNYDTAYVSAYSGKPVYLADKDQLNLLGTSYARKLQILTDDPCGLLSEVQYVYIRLSTPDHKMSSCVELLAKFSRIYNNNMVSVWRKN
jgi:branched-subunit amino acid transport protein AzlD